MIFLTLYHSLFKNDPLPNTSYRETFNNLPPKFTAWVVDGDMTLLSLFTLQIIIGIQLITKLCSLIHVHDDPYINTNLLLASTTLYVKCLIS